MTTLNAARHERTIRLLEYEPELAASVRPERRAEALASARATLVAVPRGDWDIGALVRDRQATYGLLLLDGLFSRTIFMGDIAAAHLFGRGDLVLPSEPTDTLFETSVQWSVHAPSSAALLDEGFLLSVRRWPELVAALFQRTAQQQNRSAVHGALTQLPRVEDRIHALLWHLATSWGRVTPRGILLPLHLTHETLGRLVGAKRPTVSLALKTLEASDRVSRRAGGAWLLMEAWRPVEMRGDAQTSNVGLLEPEPRGRLPTQRLGDRGDGSAAGGAE